MNLYVISLGCAKNRVDSEMLVGLLEKNNFQLVDDINTANLIMINTCAFIESAKVEAINTILDAAQIKKNGQKLIVCGCLPQRYKEISSLLPEVDRFISINEYQDFGKIIAELFKSDFNLNDKISPLNKHLSTPNYMRYIKISDGCLNHCAFCAIPLIRGKLKSVPIDVIYEEVKKSVSEGAYEINLISQDTTRYGFDLYKKNAIVDLLRKLVTIEGDFKIRLLYLYPDIVTDELIDFIKNNDKVMPYFDIPIQHSEDRLLKLMNRRGMRSYLIELIKKIRKEIPNAIIRTTLIVGFPTETNEDINNLINFMEEVKFDRLGAFTFSMEEGTLATKYEDDVKEDVKNKRYSDVMSVQKAISLELMAKYQGEILKDCFVIGYDEESYMYIARNYMFAPDDIDGVIYFAAKDEHKLGDLVNIKVLDFDEYSLIGEEYEA